MLPPLGRQACPLARDLRCAKGSPRATQPERRRSEVVTPHRTFNDHAARLWNAWDVIPSWGERRQQERRAQSAVPRSESAERRRLERRRRTGIRIALPPRLATGWVAFEC